MAMTRPTIALVVYKYVSFLQRHARFIWTAFRVHEHVLWVGVVLVFLADLLLTLYGFNIGLVERNPIARHLFAAYGVFGIVGLKVAALLFAAGLRVLIPDEYGPIVPLSLAIPWLYALGVNAYLITVSIA